MLYPERRLKVAVLDSGIDWKHIDLSVEDRSRIKEIVTFTHGDAEVDTSGHGTSIAATILRLTKNVDLYIGKIAETEEVSDGSAFIKVTLHINFFW